VLKRRIAFLMMGIMMTTPLTSFAAETWKPLIRSATREATLQTSTIKKTGSYTGAWVKEVQRLDTSNKSEKKSETLSYYLVDCNKDKIALQKKYTLNPSYRDPAKSLDIISFLSTVSRQKPLSPPTIVDRYTYIRKRSYYVGLDLAEEEYHKPTFTKTGYQEPQTTLHRQLCPKPKTPVLGSGGVRPPQWSNDY
jgi:hypothetical protein